LVAGDPDLHFSSEVERSRPYDAAMSTLSDRDGLVFRPVRLNQARS
jgi:hypothetical protein